MENILKVQIWSDVMCPYCYIGKRRIEAALHQFEYANNVAIEWKSFELDANFQSKPNDNIIEHLSLKYGKDKSWAQEMIDNMTQNAKNSGLDFHFEKLVLANSHNAHRLLHLAKEHQVANELKELLFKAYLTDGENVNSAETLIKIGQNVGLQKENIEKVLHSNEFSDAVKEDIEMAQQIGVRGVPFFVFDNKYAVSGVQPTEFFLQTLQTSWNEGNFKNEVVNLNSGEGESCNIRGCN
jgi:predicted DsbA family dithiol-disulfide isomerase